jgi:hypothetical protein
MDLWKSQIWWFSDLFCIHCITAALQYLGYGKERKGKFKFSSSIFLTERSTIIIVMVYHFGKYKTITLFCNIYPISFVSNAFYSNFSSHFVLIFGEIRIRSAGSMTEIVGNGIAIYNFKFTMEFYGNYNFKFAMCNFKFTQVYAWKIVQSQLCAYLIFEMAQLTANFCICEADILLSQTHRC